jgi:hypothetical protein
VNKDMKKYYPESRDLAEGFEESKKTSPPVDLDNNNEAAETETSSTDEITALNISLLLSSHNFNTTGSIDFSDDLAIVSKNNGAMIYRYDGNTWSEDTELNTPDLLTETHVGIDKNHAVVIGKANDLFEMHFFQFLNNEWSKSDTVIQVPNTVSLGNLRLSGDHISISGRNKSLIYKFENNTWGLQETLTEPNGQNPYYGFKSDLYQNVLVVSNAYYNNVQGDTTSPTEDIIHVYRHDDIQWQLEQSISATDAHINKSESDRFGESVAVFKDRIIVGHPMGYTHIFKYQDNMWELETTFSVPKKSDGLPSGIFGAFVAVNEMVAVVSSATTVGNPGGVYVYHKPEDTWVLKYNVDDFLSKDTVLGVMNATSLDTFRLFGNSFSFSKSTSVHLRKGVSRTDYDIYFLW